MLSKRQIMNMKWRTVFVTAAILGLFYFGPKSYKKDAPVKTGRSLLQQDDDYDITDDVDIKDLTAQPNCEEKMKPEFKKQLKFWYKSLDQPSEEEITCESSTAVAKEFCQKSEKPVVTGNWGFHVTSDECRTLTFECKCDKGGICTTGTEDSLQNITTFEPTEDDQMFPPDAFTDEQRANGGFLLHMIGVLYMFYALALVCDHFFVPTLDVIIERFDISPDVAGATLMAAGGSAPELFTSVIGVFIAVSDVGIGTIVGSAVFNVLFVIAACAFASKKALDLTAWPLIRDTSFYSIALMMLVGFFTDDTIEWWEALILFIWYLCYVIFMKFNEGVEKAFIAKFPSLGKKEEETENAGKDPKAGFKMYKRKPLLALMRGKVETGADDNDANKKGVGMEGLKIKLQGEEGDNLKEEAEEEKQENENNDDEEEPYEDYVKAGPGDSTISKVMWYLSLPLMIPMWITIPDPQDKKKEKYFVIAFFMSIIWIAAFSYFMVWWATLIGEAVGISDAVMGLTFLAAGTSVPDLITSVLVAKDGKGDMAVSSSIGSNLFDVTVGLPVPWLIYTAVYQKNIDVNSVGMGCNIAMLFLMLLIVFISILAFKWKMTKPMGGIMLVMYVIFVIVSLLLSECILNCSF